MNEFKLDPTSIKARIIRPRLKIREGVRRYAPKINLQGPAGSWLGVWKMKKKQTNKQKQKTKTKMNQKVTDFWLGVHLRAEFNMLLFIKQAFVHMGCSFQHSVMLLFCSLISCTARHSFNPDTVEFGLLDIREEDSQGWGNFSDTIRASKKLNRSHQRSDQTSYVKREDYNW